MLETQILEENPNKHIGKRFFQLGSFNAPTKKIVVAKTLTTKYITLYILALNHDFSSGDQEVQQVTCLGGVVTGDDVLAFQLTTNRVDVVFVEVTTVPHALFQVSLFF